VIKIDANEYKQCPTYSNKIELFRSVEWGVADSIVVLHHSEGPINARLPVRDKDKQHQYRKIQYVSHRERKGVQTGSIDGEDVAAVKAVAVAIR
jgi:hypothetical protein